MNAEDGGNEKQDRPAAHAGKPAMHGEHSGKNQAELFIEVFKDYGIAENLGYFVTDNAKNNNAAVDLTL